MAKADVQFTARRPIAKVGKDCCLQASWPAWLASTVGAHGLVTPSGDKTNSIGAPNVREEPS
jgi:hypothetical protein